jgi:excisionase family DNA binding protein
MTAREVAAYLNCSTDTVRRLAAGGQLPHYRLGRMVRFRRAEVDNWLGASRRSQDEAAPRLIDDPAQLSLFAEEAE